MGYTHYWEISTESFSQDKWIALLSDIGKVLRSMPKSFLGDGNSFPDEPIVIRNWEGEGKPEFTATIINFNGDESKGLEHESFLLEKQSSSNFNFCKTARKPYSFLVEVVLLLAKKHFGSQIKLSSDGNYSDWEFSIDYVENKFPSYKFKPALDDMKMRNEKEQRADNVWLAIDLTKNNFNSAPPTFLPNMLKVFNDNGVKFRTYHNGASRIYVNYTNMDDDDGYYAFGQYNNSDEFSNKFVKILKSKPELKGKSPISKWSNWK